MAGKTDIIEQLKRELLLLQGMKSCGEFSTVQLPASMNQSFPDKVFPIGAIHEMISHSTEAFTATLGFVNVILQCLMARGGPCIWISANRKLFPPALSNFGIAPERIVFVDVNTQKDVLYATLECLKCDRLAAVVSDLKELDFVQSRKLQLAVESSRVTGFILRHQPKKLETTASIARWKITTLSTQPEGTLPGIGYASWRVSLEKIRNGKTGCWDIAYDPDGLISITVPTEMMLQKAVVRKIV